MNINRQQEVDSSAGRIRWWLLAVILLITGTALYLVQTDRLFLTDRPSADLIYIIWTFQAAFFVWLMYLSRLAPIARVKLLIAIVSLEMCLYLSISVDGYAGDGKAIMTWRWAETPEERFASSRRNSSTTKVNDRNSVNLATTHPNDYPAYRGSDRTGVIHDIQLAHNLTDVAPQELWRQPVGRGWSSFAIVGEFCITQEQRGEEEAVVCYELKTGRERWVHLDPTGFFEITGGGGPRATPTIARGRVYSLGATGILNCLDGATGECLWAVDILKDNAGKNCLFGMVGSPLLVDDMVIVCPGAKDNSVVAYHADDGRKLWGGGSANSSYSSPHLVELAGQRQLINFNADGLFAHDLHDGHVLWSYPWVSNPEERNNVCQPVRIPDSSDGTDRVFISSGYGKGCAVLSITQRDQQFDVSKLWSNRNLKAKFTSVVLRDGFVYGLDEGILVCLDVNTGERRWKRGRYGHGQLILVEDLLLIQAERGEIVLVEATPEEFRELGRFAALTDRTWNQPALSGPYLVVRNDREAACFKLPLSILISEPDNVLKEELTPGLGR